MRVQKLLDLGRVNVLSSSDDHIFAPAADFAVAVAVHAADVSGWRRVKNRVSAVQNSDSLNSKIWEEFLNIYWKIKTKND